MSTALKEHQRISTVMWLARVQCLIDNDNGLKKTNPYYTDGTPVSGELTPGTGDDDTAQSAIQDRLSRRASFTLGSIHKATD